MSTHRPRHWLGVAAGLAAVLTLLALPSPHRPGADTRAATGASGPATLSTVWPAARPFTLNAAPPAGSTYTPALIIDPATFVSMVTSTDGTQSSLVVSGGAGLRVLQTHSLTTGGSYDGVTVAGNRLYWFHSVGSTSGAVESSLWSAPLSGGPAAMLTADVGQPLFTGSEHDLAPGDGHLYWTSADPTRPGSTQLRSIALAGGDVTTQVLAGSWTLSAWPWLVTAPSAPKAALRFRNLQTGSLTPITVPANKLVTCDRAWCRLILDDPTQHDGTDRQHIAGKNSNPVAGDPALLDRFEPLLTQVSQTLAGTQVSRLTLYDTGRRAQVQIDTGVTKAGARGDYVWWATGDNETLTWHALDLRTLH